MGIIIKKLVLGNYLCFHESKKGIGKFECDE